MKNYNISVVFNSDNTKVLMCRRRKEPYIGILNFVGGKIEEDESLLDAAYRELYEETSISKEDIVLHNLMCLKYIKVNTLLDVYYGTLIKDIPVIGEENDLVWVDINEDFSDISKFAGEGNIYHIMEYIKKLKNDDE